MNKFLAIFSICITTLAFSDRGDLISYEKVSELSSHEVNNLMKMYDMKGIPHAVDGVNFFKVKYETIGASSEKTIASGMVVIPQNLRENLPLMGFQHGTVPTRIDVPSRVNAQVLAATAAFGSGGYVIAAADYLGLGDSSIVMHPFCHIETMGSCGLDMIRAARHLTEKLNIKLGDELYVSGYSQGGIGAMGLLDHLQRNGEKVTALAPMAAPFDLSVTCVKTVLEAPAPLTSFYISYLLMGYNFIYGDVFDSISTAMYPPLAGYVPNLFQGNQPLGVILGMLPKNPMHLLTQEYLKNSVMNPESQLITRLKENDTYGFVPDCPTLVIYAGGDKDVLPDHSLKAFDTMKSNKVTVTLENVGDVYDHLTGRSPCHVAARKFFDDYRVQILAKKTETAKKTSAKSINKSELVTDNKSVSNPTKAAN